MNKTEIKEFFDELAPFWDKDQNRNEEVISFILEKSGIRKGVSVLDVASGTGVLFGDYLKLGASVTGIDISEEMLKFAKEKFPQVNLICEDAEDFRFSNQYDVIMIYNAFPHFPNPEMLLGNLTKALKKGGRLTVAHGMSEKELQKCHSGKAKNVSMPLPSKEKLSKMMSVFCDVDIMISDERMYMVSGVRKA